MRFVNNKTQYIKNNDNHHIITSESSMKCMSAKKGAANHQLKVGLVYNHFGVHLNKCYILISFIVFRKYKFLVQNF